MRMSGLRAGADIVMTPVAVEGIVSAAEDGLRSLWILGERVDDDSGTYYRVTGAGDARIGLAAVPEDGGTEPDGGILSIFSESFSDGVLMVVDPYAGEFALYVSEDGELRRASAVMSE